MQSAAARGLPWWDRTCGSPHVQFGHQITADELREHRRHRLHGPHPPHPLNPHLARPPDLRITTTELLVHAVPSRLVMRIHGSVARVLCTAALRAGTTPRTSDPVDPQPERGPAKHHAMRAEQIRLIRDRPPSTLLNTKAPPNEQARPSPGSISIGFGEARCFKAREYIWQGGEASIAANSPSPSSR